MGFFFFYENSVQHSDRKTFSESDVCRKEGDKDASRSETANQAEEVVGADQSESTARPRQHTDLWLGVTISMWHFQKANNITEGFDKVMEMLSRRAYGFRYFENYRLRVLTHCGWAGGARRLGWPQFAFSQAQHFDGLSLCDIPAPVSSTELLADLGIA